VIVVIVVIVIVIVVIIVVVIVVVIIIVVIVVIVVIIVIIVIVVVIVVVVLRAPPTAGRRHTGADAVSGVTGLSQRDDTGCGALSDAVNNNVICVTPLRITCDPTDFVTRGQWGHTGGRCGQWGHGNVTEGADLVSVPFAPREATSREAIKN
jgi:hypothetical protein